MTGASGNDADLAVAMMMLERLGLTPEDLHTATHTGINLRRVRTDRVRGDAR